MLDNSGGSENEDIGHPISVVQFLQRGQRDDRLPQPHLEQDCLLLGLNDPVDSR